MEPKDRATLVRERLEHWAVCAGLNDVEGWSNEELYHFITPSQTPRRPVEQQGGYLDVV